MTDAEILQMATTDIGDFINWRYFTVYPECGWLDAIEAETDAYISSLLDSEPADLEALLSR